MMSPTTAANRPPFVRDFCASLRLLRIGYVAGIARIRAASRTGPPEQAIACLKFQLSAQKRESQ